MPVDAKIKAWKWWAIYRLAPLGVSLFITYSRDELTTSVAKQVIVWIAGLLGFSEVPVTENTAFWVGVIAFAALVTLLFWLGGWVAAARNPKIYTNRRRLDNAKHGGAYPLDEVSTGHCVWLSGGKTFNADTDLKKIQKLILPSPNADSTKNFQSSNKAGTDFCNIIRTTTQTAKDRNIPVRWYPEFLGSSWWIGDRDKDSAFIHFELVLPHSLGRARPSFRIYRWQDNEAYIEYCRVFDNLWDDSIEPTDRDLDGTR